MMDRKLSTSEEPANQPLLPSTEMVQKLGRILTRAHIEQARHGGGSFVSIKGGGPGIADPKLVDGVSQQLKSLGATWVSVRIREKGFGDVVDVAAIFPDPPSVLKDIQTRYLEIERSKSYVRYREDGRSEVLRHAKVISGEQRWKRAEGYERLHAYSSGRMVWEDTRNPKYGGDSPTTYLKTSAEWKSLGVDVDTCERLA